MDMNHIQMNTKNVEAEVQFYRRYFDFTTEKAHGDGKFLWNKSGFMMAVNPLPEDPVFPDWFHVGFRLDTIDEVKTKYAQLVHDNSPIKAPLQEYDDFVFFRCLDPAGYVVEVFWEPIPNA